jgi:hypothetical protein
MSFIDIRIGRIHRVMSPAYIAKQGVDPRG